MLISKEEKSWRFQDNLQRFLIISREEVKAGFRENEEEKEKEEKEEKEEDEENKGEEEKKGEGGGRKEAKEVE